MDLLRHRILLLPLLLFAALFALDKVFYIKAVRDRVLLYKKVEPDLYESRRDLLEQLVADMPEHRRTGRHVGVILGSSRSAEFDTLEIEKVLPGTATYNFSVPMGGVAHAYYYADLLRRNGVKPDFMMVEADLVNFSNSSLSFALQYDFDPAFMVKHTNFLNPDDAGTGGFRPDETDTFFIKYLFALYRYPLDPRNVVENYREAAGFAGLNNLEFRWHHQRMVALSHKEHLGAIPNPLQIQATDEALERDVTMVRDRVLGDGRPSKTQLLLFGKLVDLAQREGIPLLVYRPVVSHPFIEIINDTDADFQEQAVKKSLEGRGHSIFVYADPESERPLQCRAFVDALHLSGACYAELTGRVFAPLRPILADRP